MLSVSYHVLLLSSGATLVKAHIKSYCEAPLQPISVLQSLNEFLDCFVPFYKHFILLKKTYFNK